MTSDDITADEYDFLLRRAGLNLTPAQAAELRPGYALVRAMAARVRGELRPREAEPAHIFVFPKEPAA